MGATLETVRATIMNDRAWASSGSTFDRRVTRAVNRALQKIAKDAPQSCAPQRFTTRIMAPVDGSSSTVNATISAVTADPKVLKFEIDASSTWAPAVDGTWDGLMHLEVTVGDRALRRQSREWWLVTDAGTGAKTYYVSIAECWRNNSDTGLAFRIYQPEFFLPGNTIKVLGPMRVYDQQSSLVTEISHGTARRQGLPDYQRDNLGKPEHFWRTREQTLVAPKTAPRLTPIYAQGDNGNKTYADWKGPVQEGKFRFCYTYVWGRVDQRYSDSPTGVRDPIWESAPSPISEAFDHEDTDNYVVSGSEKNGRAITVRVDNIDEILDFIGRPEGIDVTASPYPHVTPLRFGRSGFRVRIYAIRDDLYTDHGPATTAGGVIAQSRRLNRVDSDGRAYLLAEINPTDLNPEASTLGVPEICSFTWTGALPVPDRERPLRNIAKYFAYELDPAPDEDYDLDLQILRQPIPLVHDHDTVPLKPEAMEAFLSLCLAFLCRLDGADMAGSMAAMAIYNKFVKGLRTDTGVVTPRRWSASRQPLRLDRMREG